MISSKNFKNKLIDKYIKVLCCEKCSSDLLYWFLIGIISAFGSLAFGLSISKIIRPMFLLRYVYPASSILWLVFGVMLTKVNGKNLITIVIIILVLCISFPGAIKMYKNEIYHNIKHIETCTKINSIIEDNDSILTDEMHFVWA